MKSDSELITNLIIKDFNLNEAELPQAQNNEEIHQALKRVINHLLDKDLERLLTALYRIDVEEQKFKQILSDSKPDSIASELANLIIERQIKKIETRRKYSQ